MEKGKVSQQERRSPYCALNTCASLLDSAVPPNWLFTSRVKSAHTRALDLSRKQEKLHTRKIVYTRRPSDPAQQVAAADFEAGTFAAAGRKDHCRIDHCFCRGSSTVSFGFHGMNPHFTAAADSILHTSAATERLLHLAAAAESIPHLSSAAE